jgi:amyloid beta (A4) precursor protein-binding family B protein 2 (Fe65-like)
MHEYQSNRPADITSPTESTDSGIQINMEQTTADDTNLPSGWERFEDEEGVYYWHKRTGTVTRERPELINDSPSSTLSSSSSNDICFESNSFLSKTESNPSIKVLDETTQQHRFHVRSLGWTTIDDEDLTTERSSRSVNRCIYELTRGINDGIGRWGEGKDLYMDINNTDLLLIDPTEMTILHKQSIPSIRVWGVGRETSRDFAYVAKDKDRSTRIYKCHVFRCDNTSARTIANTLRDTCRNLMIERGLLTKPSEISEEDLSILKQSITFTNDGTNIPFPTPMEEPKDDLPCTYLGCIYVEKPSGMDILRSAIEKVSKTVPEDKWLAVTVNISPASFTITTDNESKDQLLDCRIRYLSFLGVGQDPSFCGIIIHCADNSFKCHVFHCLPSCIQLCKNIEAACKLRYQKCLDAHPQAARQIESTKSYGAQIKSFVESFWFGNKQSV